MSGPASPPAPARTLRRDPSRQGPSRRRLLTPEGVDLTTRLGDVGVRIGAFTIDLLILIFTLIAIVLLIDLSGMEDWIGDGEALVSSILTIAVFVLRYFYFTIMESGRRAATFGKRLMKIRVASRTSPRLTASAVFVRNALRELEFFLPIQLLIGAGGRGVDGWIGLMMFLWVSVFLFFPLFNRDRLRVGDLLAGTWVVRNPRPELLADLSETRTRGDFAFTPAQVDAYGVHELHVLEDVLRSKEGEVQRDVAARIRRKIDWVPAGVEDDRAFLDAYYRALRERLESRLMFGVRRADKHDTR